MGTTGTTGTATGNGFSTVEGLTLTSSETDTVLAIALRCDLLDAMRIEWAERVTARSRELDAAGVGDDRTAVAT